MDPILVTGMKAVKVGVGTTSAACDPGIKMTWPGMSFVASPMQFAACSSSILILYNTASRNSESVGATTYSTQPG